MIRPINKLIEKYLLAYLHRKRDAIIIDAVKRFESDYPEATALQKGILKTRIMHEKTRVSPIVDGHLKAAIIRAQQTFWFTVLCNLMLSLVGIFFSGHIFAIFSPVINALIAWTSTWGTSTAAYEQRVIAAMDSTIITYVIETGLQHHPLERLLTDAIIAPPPEEPIGIVIDNGEVNENEEAPLISPANYSIFQHLDAKSPDEPEPLSPHPVPSQIEPT